MAGVAEFLRGHELFAELGAADLEALAGRAHVERFPAGAVIESAGGVRLIRRGAVDLLEDARPLDRLGEGELIGHQVEAMRAGRAPDDYIDPRTLNPLARRYLRGAFRAIASIQRSLGNELELGDPGI